MQEEMLRARHSHGRLRCDEPRGLERGADDLLLTARNDLAHQSEFARFGSGEVARGECELAEEALVARDFREAREGSDVRCEADVDFLQARAS